MSWALRTGTPATGGGAGSPRTLVLGAAVSLNDRIVLVIEVSGNNNNPPTLTSVTDNLGNTYTLDLAGVNINDVVNVVQFRQWIYSAPVTNAGTPTISVAGDFANGVLSAAAYSGLSVASNAVDVSVAAGSYPGNSSPTSGATAATTGLHELVIGAFSEDGQSKTFTAGTGFTVRTSGSGNGYNGDIALEDKDSGASLATQLADGTLNSSAPWDMNCVVYKLSGGATTGPRVTQAPVEALERFDTTMRVTQAPIEALERFDTNMRVTQAVVEVLYLHHAGICASCDEYSDGPLVVVLKPTPEPQQFGQEVQTKAATGSVKNRAPSQGSANNRAPRQGSARGKH